MKNIESRHIGNYETALSYLHKYLLKDQCEHLFEPVLSFLNVSELIGTSI